MDIIEEKKYEYSKKIVLKDGTIKEYKFNKTYNPVDKENKVTQKKVIDKVKEANKEQLNLIYKYIVNELHI